MVAFKEAPTKGKVIFNKLSNINCVIFDEVDTGVSGKVARAVGQKMKQIGNYCQVISITHLPQVASLATYHFFVDKIVENNITATRIKELTNDEKVFEIAKMLSGESPSEFAIENAKELLKAI